ncbi:MAG: VCBS repeat-containing protein [Phycisphaerales bacterium]
MTTTTCRLSLFGGLLCAAGISPATPEFTTVLFDTIEVSAGYVTDIHPGDFNLDGRTDFVVNSVLRGQGLRWYESTSRRAFVFREVLVNPYFEHAAVVPVDLDGDGDEDLAATSQGFFTYSNATLGWHNNVGAASGVMSFNGSFDRLKHTPGDFRWAGFSEIAAGDIDSDGDQDLVVTGTGIESVAWFENKVGPHNPRMEKHIIEADLLLHTRDGNPGGYGSVRIGDLNMDSHPDIVLGAQDAILVYFSNGGSPPTFHKALAARSPGVTNIDLADFNGDTVPDIVFGTDSEFGSAGALGVLINTGTQPPDFRQRLIATDGPFHEVHAGDIDRDGHTDIVVTRSRNTGLDAHSAILWYQNRGLRFTRRVVLQETNLQCRWSTALFDLDSDGDLDIVSATRTHPPVLDLRPIDSIRFHVNGLLGPPSDWPSAGPIDP